MANLIKSQTISTTSKATSFSYYFSGFDGTGLPRCRKFLLVTAYNYGDALPVISSVAWSGSIAQIVAQSADLDWDDTSHFVFTGIFSKSFTGNGNGTVSFNSSISSYFHVTAIALWDIGAFLESFAEIGISSPIAKTYTAPHPGCYQIGAAWARNNAALTAITGSTAYKSGYSKRQMNSGAVSAGVTFSGMWYAHASAIYDAGEVEQEVSIVSM